MGRKTYETKWSPHLDRIEQMALEGLSYAEIGRIFKVEGYVIRNLLYRHGRYITRKDVAKSSPEIKRLREALKVFADNVKETNVGIDENWAKTVNALKAENQRLREALKEIVKRDAGVNKFGEKDMSTLGWIAYNALWEKE